MWEDANFLPNDPEHGWNGYYKTEEMQAGVFVYYAIVTLIDGSELLLEGDVTLMR